jgi:hypothetical protein
MWIAGRRDKLGSFAIADPSDCRSIQANRDGQLRFFTGGGVRRALYLRRSKS